MATWYRRFEHWLTDPDARWRMPVFTAVVLLGVAHTFLVAQQLEHVQGEAGLLHRYWEALSRVAAEYRSFERWLMSHFKP